MTPRACFSRASITLSIIAAGSALMPVAADAAAPAVKRQAPGFYRMMLGDCEITALSDGTLVLPVDKLLTNTTPEKITERLGRAYLKSPVETSINAFLINTGAKLVLVDAGSGGRFGPTGGDLLTNLKAAGYQPEQVDFVLITHFHGDHMGGLTANGKPVFPNAVVMANKRETDYWLSKANRDKAGPEQKGGFDLAKAVMDPYAAAGKLKPFDGDIEIVSGVKAIAAAGHTPGHNLYAVESKGQKLLLWGDLMHVAAVQFPEPAVTIQFDSDSPAAAVQRKKFFAEAGAQGYWVGIAHVSFPGIGHLRADGAGYVWMPVNYSTRLSE